MHCSSCGLWKQRRRRGTICSGCHNKIHRDGHQSTSLLSPLLSPQLQLAQNASQLMATLPVHSHHRAPLLHHLSQGMSSADAAPLLHTSASYIRECKRKNFSESDLLQDKYARGVKRQKLSDGTVAQIFNFIVAACPTPSGSCTLTFKQYVNDGPLYQAYVATLPAGTSRASANDCSRPAIQTTAINQ